MTLEENVQAFGLTYFGMNDKRQGSDHQWPTCLASPRPVHIMAGAGGNARVSIMHMIALMARSFRYLAVPSGLKRHGGRDATLNWTLNLGQSGALQAEARKCLRAKRSRSVRRFS